MKKILILLVVANLLAAKGQSIQWLDTLAYSGTTHIYNICSDSSGYLYLSGDFGPTSAHGDTSLPGIFVSKYDTLGNLLWTDKKNSKSLSAGGIVTDKEGNTYAAFLAWNTVSFGTYSFSTSNSAIGFSMILVKYNTSGTVIWAKMIDNAGPSGLLLDKNEILYVYGTTNGTANFDSYSVGETKNFVARYDTNGTCNFLLSTGQYIGSVSIDGAGNLFLVDNQGLKKYNSGGVLQWTWYSYNQFVDVDVYGNCYLWGRFGGSVTFGNTTLTNPYSNGAIQSFLAKLDANGNALWAITPQSPYYFMDIFLNDKNIYVTGNTGNDDPWGDRHGFISKYDTSGNLIKDNIYIQNNNSSRVHQSLKGCIYVSGGNWSYGGDIVRSFFAKLSSYGSFGVGIKDNEPSTSDIAIYPNPTGGIINLQGSGEFTLTHIQVKDVMGRTIYSKKISANGYGVDERIDLSRYPKGVYFVQVSTGAATEIKKIILE